MNLLLPNDIDWCVRRIPNFLRKILKTTPRCCLAGGFVRDCIINEEPSDIDLFTHSKESAKELALKIADGDAKKLFTTDNAITIKPNGGSKVPPIQVISRWTFEHPTDVVASFDFTIASAAIWWSEVNCKWISSCHSRFYPDLAAKRLVYTRPERNEDAGGSLLRVLKFYQRGYNIPLDSFAAVITRLMRGVEELNYPDEEKLEHVITGLLFEVDPLAIPLKEQ